eukprot:Blabericola_migrator_1__1912@NODE_1520_length_4355_cov_26_982276_g1000_i0_p3_GENE_NODE_1520_length_4355_cov_26_982276_g1000_i0NODE_1520_length_4355_cov_26_982276_g1000_i0_p3_ORF_typecomplete_len297_score24_65RVT_1/PF00078_27/2_2e06Spuma_A9PTase/PF03539_14/3_4e06HEPN_SAV2148/PF18725_1/0_065_NODE_1520_length_4355_cov_26_982276_g1000_i021153005
MMRVEGAVVPGKSLLLGLPFLFEHQAILNLRRKVLILHGRAHQLCSRPRASTPRVQHVHFKDLDTGEQQRCEELLSNATADTILSPTALHQLRRIMLKYVDLWKDDAAGQTNVTEHAIELTTARPITCRPRRYSQAEKNVIEREITDMLQKDVIRPSHSPYASSIVLVKKKTGDIRFCLDFRQLNNYTVRDAYPLPRIADLLDAIQGSRYFVALDMRSGYWQIRMRNEDIPKTAFLSHRGLYEFTVMPFGLVNAPATFQRMVDRLFVTSFTKEFWCISTTSWCTRRRRRSSCSIRC